MRIVIPKSTNTIAMLMVDVIFAFKNRAVDTFFFFDIEMELNSVCYFYFRLLQPRIFPKSGAK